MRRAGRARNSALALLIGAAALLAGCGGSDEPSSEDYELAVEHRVEATISGHQESGSMEFRGCEFPGIPVMGAVTMEEGNGGLGPMITCEALFRSDPGLPPSETLAPLEVELTGNYCLKVEVDIFSTESVGAATVQGAAASGMPLGTYHGCIDRDL